jgi:tripartite ATP-independent transporter DctM subunit
MLEPAVERLPVASVAGPRAARVQRALRAASDAVSVVLLGAEVLILFASVVARYVLGSPLGWADELSTTLFVWLAMTGAVSAAARERMMRITVAERLVGPAVRRGFERGAAVVTLVVSAVAVHGGLAFALEEAELLTPSLEISGAWRASAVPVGFAAIGVLAFLRLLERETGSVVLWMSAASGLALAAMALGPGATSAAGNWNLALYYVAGLALLLFIGAPIALAFAAAAIAYVAFATEAPLLVIAGRIGDGMSHLTLLAIPLFVLLGLLLEGTGMARAMVGFLAQLLGHVRGGLSYVLVGAMYLVSGISGSKAADMAAVAPALFPEMKKRGAEPGELASLLSATGAQTETIPPSLLLITVGSVSGLSISALFVAGLLPAAVVGLALCAAVAWRSRHGAAAPSAWAGWSPVGAALLVALPALALPFVIRMAVVEGIATATEVSTIGIAYTLVVGILVYREFQWRRLVSMLVDTAVLSGSILLIVGAATALGWGLIRSGFGSDLAAAMTTLPGGAVTFMVVSIAVFIVLGSILEGIPAAVLLAPLLFPIAKAVGIHPIHYAMVAILAMGLGLFAPPLGVGYYTACAIGQVDPDEALPHVWRYLWPVAVGLAVVAAVPWISIAFL